MCYAHVVDNTWLVSIWFDLALSTRDNFHPTLEDACRAIARRISLSPSVITNGVDKMVRGVRFSTRYYASMVAGASAFLFSAHTLVAAKKLQDKSSLWDDALRGNVCP